MNHINFFILDKLVNTLSDQTDNVNALLVISSMLLASASNKHVNIYNWKSGVIAIKLSGHEGKVNCMTLLRNMWLVSGSDDKTIKVWDIYKENCLQTLEGHADKIKSLAILPKDCIASGSADRTIKLWDLNTGLLVTTLKGHLASVNALCSLSNRNIVNSDTIRIN